MSSVDVVPSSPRRVRVAAPTGHIVRAHLASGLFKKTYRIRKVTFVIDRSSSHDSHPCLARRAFGLLKPRLTALRVYPAALVSKCQSWFRSNQRPVSVYCADQRHELCWSLDQL